MVSTTPLLVLKNDFSERLSTLRAFEIQNELYACPEKHLEVGIGKTQMGLWAVRNLFDSTIMSKGLLRLSKNRALMNFATIK